MGLQDKKEMNRQQILASLNEDGGLQNSIQIMNVLKERGIDLSERSIRLYLNQLDEEGLTFSHGKKGRMITEKGKIALKAQLLMDRVGFMSAKIDNMTFGMNFDLALRRGTVVINTAVMKKEVLKRNLDQITEVFEAGYAMGTLVSLLKPGEKAGGDIIPPGSVGFCTVCSVTLNGVLLKHGIPARSLFSGLLDLEDGKPTRFSELINYEGTSIDPLQLFIRSRLTDYIGAITTGNGKIGAGFREIPRESYDLVKSLAESLKTIGLGAFMKIGQPSRSLLNIPVREGCCGVIVIGGLNPVAILEERGEEVSHTALSGYKEFNSLFPYTELPERLETIS